MSAFPSNIRLANAMRGGFTSKPSGSGFDIDYGAGKTHWVQAKDYHAVCGRLNDVQAVSDERLMEPQREGPSKALAAFLADDERSQSSGRQSGGGV